MSALRDWIEFMIVTLRATDGKPEPNRAYRAHTVHRGLATKLLLVHAALLVGERLALEGRGELLLARHVRQQIARELLDGETIERHVVVEGVDDPLAPEPHETRAVKMVPAGIRISGQIEPELRHSLAVLRRRQQPVYDFLVGVWIPVCQKSINFRNRRRQPGQVEVDAAEKSGFVGLRRWVEFLLFEPFEDKIINFGARPFLILDRGQFGTPGRDV